MQESGTNAEKNPCNCELEMEHVEETNEEMKNNLTNALTYCKSLLESENLLTNTLSRNIVHFNG